MDVTLYIGPATAYKKFRFTDRSSWEALRSQILSAMNAGKGTIEIPEVHGTLAGAELSGSMTLHIDNDPSVDLALGVRQLDFGRLLGTAGLAVDGPRKSHYRERMESVTYWLLEELASRNLRATFYVVGELAEMCHDRSQRTRACLGA